MYLFKIYPVCFVYFVILNHFVVVSDKNAYFNSFNFNGDSM